MNKVATPATFSHISGTRWLMNIANKARKAKLPARRILDRQQWLRRMFGIPGLIEATRENISDTTIERFNAWGGLVYFASRKEYGQLYIAMGDTAKEAYKKLDTYSRNMGKNADVASMMMLDMMLYSEHIVAREKAARPDLKTSDILAPKHGRIVN